MNTMTTDKMIAYLEKAMNDKHHKDWIKWVSQNKVFKLKPINITDIAPADGLELDHDKIDNMSKTDLSDAPLIVVHKDGTIIDGNHRFEALKKQGVKKVQAYVGESNTKLNLKLVNQEISEARLFRTTRSFGNLTGEDVAKLLYLSSLSTFMMLKDEGQASYAEQYIKQTVQYGSYTLFRSHATDLYLLAYQVNNPDNNVINLKNDILSKNHLKKCQFDDRKHHMFFKKLTVKSITNTEAGIFFLRLESQLKITENKYKSWRRLISDWENLKYSSRQLVVSKILQEYRRLGKGSELVEPLTNMVKYKSYRISDKFDKPKTSTTTRVAGTVAGAVAGRYAGKKLAQKLGKDVDKYKKAGTGIGAIAGYWASGRIKK